MQLSTTRIDATKQSKWSNLPSKRDTCALKSTAQSARAYQVRCGCTCFWSKLLHAVHSLFHNAHSQVESASCTRSPATQSNISRCDLPDASGWPQGSRSQVRSECTVLVKVCTQQFRQSNLNSFHREDDEDGLVSLQAAAFYEPMKIQWMDRYMSKYFEVRIKKLFLWLLKRLILLLSMV